MHYLDRNGARVAGFWLRPAEVMVFVGAGETPVTWCGCKQCAIERAEAVRITAVLASKLSPFVRGVHNVIDAFQEGCGIHVVTPKRGIAFVHPAEVPSRRRDND